MNFRFSNQVSVFRFRSAIIQNQFQVARNFIRVGKQIVLSDYFCKGRVLFLPENAIVSSFFF